MRVASAPAPTRGVEWMTLVAVLASSCNGERAGRGERAGAPRGVTMPDRPAGDRTDDRSGDPPAPGADVLTTSCRVMEPHEGCVSGPATRPSRPVSSKRFLTTDGRSVFSYGNKETFDAATFGFATVTDCPVWDDVFAWDKHDVYVLDPQSCGQSCGDDYWGYAWVGLGVVQPRGFRWLPGGYAVDERFVYNRWHHGPLASANSATFEVLGCGGDRGFVIGRDGTRLFHDGWPISEQEVLRELRGAEITAAAARDDSAFTSRR